MLHRLGDDAKRAVVAAQSIARTDGSDRIGALHLLAGCLRGGGGVAERLAALGVTPDALFGDAAPTPPPEPMTRAEEKELRDQMRDRGIPLAKAEQIVARLQRQREVGPTSLGPDARAVLERATTAGDGVSVEGLLITLLASPPGEVADALARLGARVAAVREALAG